MAMRAEPSAHSGEAAARAFSRSARDPVRSTLAAATANSSKRLPSRRLGPAQATRIETSLSSRGRHLVAAGRACSARHPGLAERCHRAHGCKHASEAPLG